MNNRPPENVNFYLRECISYNPKVRVEVSHPMYGYLGASNYFLYTVSDKQLKSSVDFTEAGKILINSDESIEVVAGELSDDKSENILIHARRGNISITADRTGTIRISGHHVVIDSDGDLELVAGNDMILDASHIKIQGPVIDQSGVAGNAVPPDQTLLAQVFEGSFVGFEVIQDALGLGVADVLTEIIDFVELPV